MRELWNGWRVLDDPDRGFAEEALDNYLPRAIYVLFTLINRLESLPEHRRILSALLLSVFDQATSLWAYPTQRARPRILTIPTHFRENNIWSALENSIEQWAVPQGTEPVSMVNWPELPPHSGGLCLYKGRVKDFIDEITSDNLNQVRRPQDMVSFEAMVSAIPRPNQAFWTLSVLWAGWLWGKTAAAHFKSILRRRRFDWVWHTSALHSAFSSILELKQGDLPALCMVSEVESGFLTSTLLAGTKSGMKLKGIALREETGNAQIHWSIPGVGQEHHRKKSNPRNLDATAEIHKKSLELFGQRNEPLSYADLLSTAFLAINSKDGILLVEDQSIQDAYAHFNNLVSQVFGPNSVFIRFGGSEHSHETGKWWVDDMEYGLETRLENVPREVLSLSDRVEMSVVKLLVERHHCTYPEIDHHICHNFPGLLTPERSLIHACVSSYAVQEKPDYSEWVLRDEDHPASRRQNLYDYHNQLKKLGHNLAFEVKEGVLNPQFFLPPIHWMDEKGKLAYIFFIQASALLSKTLFLEDHPFEKCVLVIPGGRSALLDYKLSIDFRLAHAAKTGWRFLKFRHLRHLANSDTLNRESLESMIATDTITKSDAQIKLL